MDSKTKLGALRKQLEKLSLAAYLQPVHDEYMNEYPPACNRRVEWLCGFSGSAGTVVVLPDKAAFFTDGRYTLQAKTQIDSVIFGQHNSGELSPEAWLAEHLRSGDCVGYDAKLYTPHMIARMEARFKKKNITLVPVENLVDAVWKDRPAAPATQVFIHEMKYTGEDAARKRRRIAADIKAAGADCAIIAAPDSVCWLLNIRARDIQHTPLLLAPVIIDAEGRVRLYVSSLRCHAGIRAHLGEEVTLRPPAHLEEDLKQLARQRVLVDSHAVPLWYTHILNAAGATLIECRDPCVLPKATKNAVQLKGMRAAHVRDGAAVVKLLCWLDNEVARRPVLETEICDKLLALRAQHRLFVEPSFPTISGSGPHGAIVHYRVTEESDRVLKKGELMLLDSGGQYPDGTTDITRTVPIGKPGREHKDCFTRVLKGHIAIALAQFPRGTCGSQLDALARQYLWQAGLDYDHGTGHGVGHFLGVHEGPQRISKRGGDAPLLPGMIVSNEPGYYKAGAFGIRIESLVAVVEQKKNHFAFETITCVPIDTRLVSAAMLTTVEKKWLNAYHAWVRKSLSPKLTAPERRWLNARCAAI